MVSGGGAPRERVGLGGISGFCSTFTAIDVPGATQTGALGINDHGQIVGACVGGGIEYGFLLDKGTFTTTDVLGAGFTEAFGINNCGQIVGTSTGTEAFGINDRVKQTITLKAKS